MVTVIAGRPTKSTKAVIVSMSDVVGSNSRAEFDISERSKITVGEPKWANYVKGCIATFIGKNFSSI